MPERNRPERPESSTTARHAGPFRHRRRAVSVSGRREMRTGDGEAPHSRGAWGVHPARASSARATRIDSAPRAAGTSANASLRSLHARARLIRRPARGAVRGPARARVFASRGATLPRAVPASSSLAALRAAGYLNHRTFDAPSSAPSAAQSVEGRPDPIWGECSRRPSHGGGSREPPPSTTGDPLACARTGRGSGPRACLTSEARSSRGPPARPQRERKRVGRAQQAAVGLTAGARLPSPVLRCPRLSGGSVSVLGPCCRVTPRRPLPRPCPARGRPSSRRSRARRRRSAFRRLRRGRCAGRGGCGRGRGRPAAGPSSLRRRS